MSLLQFVTGYVKGLVFVPPLLANIEEMKHRITAAFETVTKTCCSGFGTSSSTDSTGAESQAALILNIYENLSQNQQIFVHFFVNLTNKTYDLQHKMYVVSL